MTSTTLNLQTQDKLDKICLYFFKDVPCTIKWTQIDDNTIAFDGYPNIGGNWRYQVRFCISQSLYELGIDRFQYKEDKSEGIIFSLDDCMNIYSLLKIKGLID